MIVECLTKGGRLLKCAPSLQELPAQTPILFMEESPKISISRQVTKRFYKDGSIIEDKNEVTTPKAEFRGVLTGYKDKPLKKMNNAVFTLPISGKKSPPRGAKSPR